MDRKFNEVSRKAIAEKLGCTPEQVYCVWQCKTLQNIKGLFSSDVESAKGKYYEATYNGDKQELYLDSYTKESNELIKVTL
ncbi:DUF6275 family protein [Enterococcus italicus]|uniref:DUF6275 family protein n=1 Tax=Enterococcus italicus TaxID=246144 RepID=UPI00207331EE|nr:DUF6275 family protein [Enterococcus italicus]